MTERLDLEAIGIRPEIAARAAVIGQTMLDLVGTALHHSNEEDFGIGYQHYVLPGKTHFYNGKEITPETRNNLRAGITLVHIPSQLSPVDRKKSTLTKLVEEGNDNAEGAIDMLTHTGLYTSNVRPSKVLRALAPALKQYTYGVKHESLRELKETVVADMLPEDPQFIEAYQAMRTQAAVLVCSVPLVDVTVLNFDAVMEAVKDFDTATRAPVDITDGSWAVSDMVRDVPRFTEKRSYYSNLHRDNAAEYLQRFTADIVQLSDALKT